MHVCTMNEQQFNTLRVVVDDCQVEWSVAFSVWNVLCSSAGNGKTRDILAHAVDTCHEYAKSNQNNQCTHQRLNNTKTSDNIHTGK